MSSALDKALLAMSLEEEEVDEPLDLQVLPEFCSSERNILSIVGRLLNLMCQKMSSLILDMPRKWKLYDKVRGVALSKEKFQFIFQFKEDMEDILEQGMHNYNDWGLAIERWSEHPTADSLQFIPIWVQISNIPMNHRTVEAITALGDVVSPTTVVLFDPKEAQKLDFVRVRVKFDISKPLKRYKVVKVKGGGTEEVSYHFERVQKRCYFCQRLTHEQDVCPFRLKKLRKSQEGKDASRPGGGTVKEPLIKALDPLFGVLSDKQVGINPDTGRPKIAKEVLDGMRQYLIMASGPEKLVRAERIKKSISDMGNDIFAQKSMLSLEPVPIISKDLNKGKGRVYDFEQQEKSKTSTLDVQNGPKLMGDAIVADQIAKKKVVTKEGILQTQTNLLSSSRDDPMTGSTVYRVGFSEASSSGTGQRKMNTRRRPSKRVRNLRKTEPTLAAVIVELKQGLVKGEVVKRKATDEAKVPSKIARREPEVVPMGGLPAI